MQSRPTDDESDRVRPRSRIGIENSLTQRAIPAVVGIGHVKKGAASTPATLAKKARMTGKTSLEGFRGKPRPVVAET